MKKIIIFLILLVPGTILMAQHQDGHNHEEHLEKLISSYLEVKNALAADDFDTAYEYLKSFGDEVLTSREMTHHPEHSAKHEKHHSLMAEAVKQNSEADTIEQLRGSFSDITKQLLKAVENLGYTNGPLYIQFCPMAGDDGARWLSDNEEILNPYYGARMLRCGRVVEQIHS